jgi:hypothetical protein
VFSFRRLGILRSAREVMQKALEVVNTLKERGIIKEYAIGGGIAVIFYVEPLLTYDLDIFFLPSTEEGLATLSPLYDSLRRMGYREDKEHIVIDGVPVQFIPVYNRLVEGAVRDAVGIEYKKTKTRVVRAEHLIAIMTQTFRPKDKERIIRLLEQAELDLSRLAKILADHGLKEKFDSFRKMSYGE